MCIWRYELCVMRYVCLMTMLRGFGVLLFTTHLVASRLHAQFYWLDDKGERAAIRAEFSRPFINAANLKSLTGALFLSVSGKFGQNTRMEAEVPIAAGGLEGTGSTYTVGNPYLGLRLHQPGKRFSTQ